MPSFRQNRRFFTTEQSFTGASAANIGPRNIQKFQSWRKPSRGAILDRQNRLNRGLVGAWIMNEASGETLFDSSGFSNKGTITNGPTWITGKFGPALSFDGVNDYVSIASKPITAGPFSVSTWSNITGSGIQAIYSQSSANIAMYIRPDVSNTFETVVDGANGDFSPNNSFVAGNWYNFVMTYDGANVRGYVNGKLAIGPTARTAVYTGGTGELGRYNSGSSYTTGLIDDIRIYNRALNADEIQALYLRPFAVFLPPNVRNYWWDLVAPVSAPPVTLDMWSTFMPLGIRQQVEIVSY
jgi:hypothetical protein